MVFLFTRLADDTTTDIIGWLKALGKPFFRLNTAQGLKSLYIDLNSNNVSWQSGNRTIHFDVVDSFYFNGGSLFPVAPGVEDAHLRSQLTDHLKGEIEAGLYHAFASLHGKRTFGLSPFSGAKINKLTVLKAAEAAELNIPPTRVVSAKTDLKQLKRDWGRIINKSIDRGINVHTDKVRLGGQKTEEITDEVIEAMDDFFFPSLVQQLVEKMYEIRVFYFRERFYSIAIFTQNNELTKIDGRGIDIKKPNREVPFRLPGELQIKVSNLMSRLGLNYGSIDFIYTTRHDYCFLEVNPYGQYGFLSAAGNYYIEKEIAEYL